MPTKASATPSSIYQLKVTLHGSKPPIWRRLQVPSNTSLAKLHDMLQISMGWPNSHLHQFIVLNQAYSDPSFELENTLNEQRMTLQRLQLQSKMRFSYEYDMGDYWQHDILLERVLDPESDVYYPRCVAGKRACPPEDCGGLYGYYELLEPIQDAQHPDHEEMLEWLGGDFDPDAFDLDPVNSQLRALG